MRLHLLILFLLLSPAMAGEDLADWWRGPGVSGDWWGAREGLEERGLVLDGRWRGINFGILSSQQGAHNAFDEEVVFGAQLDLAKALKMEALKGLQAFGDVRWRDPGTDANPNNYVEASSLFAPSRYRGGVGWRLTSFGLRYAKADLFGVKDLLTGALGWLRPQREFIIQPLAGLFANNAMGSAKGLGGNVPFSGSFSTWGGTLEANPVSWHYTKAGLFMSYPDATAPSNHGTAFVGDARNPAENGLYFLGETGVTPKLGTAELPGRYAFGGYFYGEGDRDAGGDRYGFYWQADQMVYREPSVGDELSDEGLRLFTLFTMGAAYNTRYPFYAHGGLVYEGLLPGRDQDQLMFGAAVAQYSYPRLLAARSEGEAGANYSVLMECGYRVPVSAWAFVQPFAQCIVQPDGTTEVANAAIIGVFLGVDF